MGRIIALDYGKKRTGIAATDPLKIKSLVLNLLQKLQELKQNWEDTKEHLKGAISLIYI